MMWVRGGSKNWCLVSPHQLHNIHHNNIARHTGVGLLLGVFVLRRNQNNLGGKPLIVVILTIVTAVTLTKPHQTLTGSEMFYSQHSVLLLQFTGRFSICLCLNKKPAQKTGKGEVGDLI